MERIIDDPEYDILEAGDDVKRRATPWSETKPTTHQLYRDGKAVETNGVILNEKKAEELTAKITAEAAKQRQPVQGGVEAESTVQETVPEENAKANVMSHLQTHLTSNDRPPPMQPCILGGTGHEHVTDPSAPNTRPYRSKPPPAVAA